MRAESTDHVRFGQVKMAFTLVHGAAAHAVDGLAAAADFGLVEDVVVDEGGHVDHLDDGAESDMGIGGFFEGWVGCEAAEGDEAGAEHFAAVAFDVVEKGVERGEF